MSDFSKAGVGLLQVGCQIFKVGCRMAPISFRNILPPFEIKYINGAGKKCDF